MTYKRFRRNVHGKFLLKTTRKNCNLKCCNEHRPKARYIDQCARDFMGRLNNAAMDGPTRKASQRPQAIKTRA